MKASTLKKIVLTAAICFMAFISKAQLGNNYSLYDIGAAGTINTVSGDAITKTTTIAGTFTFSYNQTPFLNYIFEAQGGKLEGGSAAGDYFGRQFSNSFVAFDARAQVQAGEIIDYANSAFANGIKNFYLSTGVGYIVNHVKTNRYSVQDPGFYTPGLDNSYAVFIPLRFGYEFKIFNSVGEPSVKIDLGYQLNFLMSDELDGFNVGHNNDAFSQVSIGVKFAIAGKSSYKKQIYY
jgi:hypothetical protein